MILRVLASLIAGAGFAIIFSVPAGIIPLASCVAALGWLVYEFTSGLLGLALSVFLSSLIIGILSRLIATLKHWPLQPLIVVGIVPLVPGSSAFYAMQSFMSEELCRAFEYSYRTFSSASGIVIGLVASSTVFNIIEKIIELSNKNNNI